MQSHGTFGEAGRECDTGRGDAKMGQTKVQDAHLTEGMQLQPKDCQRTPEAGDVRMDPPQSFLLEEDHGGLP